MHKNLIREEDSGLPENLRRCLCAEHIGERVLPLNEFHKHFFNQKRRKYICRHCIKQQRALLRKQLAESSREKSEKPESAVCRSRAIIRGMRCNGFYKITRDPENLFHGLFRKYDFAISFEVQVWTEGSKVVDELGQIFTVQYGNNPGLLREDGMLFELFVKYQAAKFVPAEIR